MKRAVTLAAVLAGGITTTGQAAIAPALPQQCSKRFTLYMGKRGINYTWRGVRDVTSHDRSKVDWYIRCQWKQKHRPVLRQYRAQVVKAWVARRNPPLQGPVTASWYEDGGSTACGFHATYGFASLILPCGSRVMMEHDGHRVVATMQDHGPYIAGRTFDLNPTLRDALGCGGLCDVYWHSMP